MKRQVLLVLGLLLFPASSRASEEHIELNYGSTYINIFGPGGFSSPPVHETVFGRQGLVARLLSRTVDLSQREADTPESIDATLLVSESEDDLVLIQIIFAPGHPRQDEFVTLEGSGDSTINGVCRVLFATECNDTRVLNGMQFAVPTEQQLSAEAPQAVSALGQPNVNFGSPGEISETSFYIVGAPEHVKLPPLPVAADELRAAPLSDIIEGVPVGSEPETDAQPSQPDEEGAAPPTAVGTPWFVVHCTAFQASDEQIAKAVRNLRSSGKRNKGYVWVNSKGELLEVVELSDRRELATRTESTPYCPLLATKARPLFINVEMHYFCSERNSVAATDAQYKGVIEFYKKAKQIYGAMNVTSHRHVDRGIAGAHTDPPAHTFSFDRLREQFEAAGIGTNDVFFLSSAQQQKAAKAEHKHFFPPDVAVSLQRGTDDCQ
ncbi:conserved exported hypothetical protein [Mesorhizobium prunaredense]|uniref:N-acetylmuramoyl-L-alanine amidase domain-containing protein n=1 Tax=Mesorhizobium prunaredense TaxID=1631249 RepID=A0A1R3VK35_9HYPH|nr:hypothetical protein [Mesorhizobium prunaredense]SIT58804.1 conserved exported hypothetical protein [Mesorhizobium prunaredense]